MDFPAAYKVVHREPSSADHEWLFGRSGASHVGARLTFEVVTDGGSRWAGAVALGENSVLRAVTGLYSTPNPTRLCLVARGDAYLIDVRDPNSGEVIHTGGPVVALRAVTAENLLLLSSSWHITAIGPSGVIWQTARLSIDGIRLDEVDGSRLAGVADPESEEPSDFSVDLRTGSHEGGVTLSF